LILIHVDRFKKLPVQSVRPRIEGPQELLFFNDFSEKEAKNSKCSSEWARGAQKL